MATTLFSYVCEKEPKKSIDIVKMISPMNPRNGNEALRSMIAIASNGTEQQKEDLLLSIRDIHPDKELFFSVDNESGPQLIVPTDLAPIDYNRGTGTIPTKNEQKCGCGKDHSLMAIGDSNNSAPETVTKTDLEIYALKTEKENNKLTKDIVFKVVVVIAIIAILYKIFNK